MVFDGDSEALREHRLSVAEMGPAIAALLKALRRTGSALSVDVSAEATEYGARGGRLSNLAKTLDLQIESIEAGSVGLGVRCVQAVGPGDQLDMWFAAQTAVRLVRDIEQEAKGQFRNAMARSFLRALPPSVKLQKYVVFSGAQELARVEIGDVNTPEVPAARDRLSVFEGVVAKLYVEPGKEAVEFRRADGTGVVRTTATADQLEDVIASRHGVLRVVAILAGEKSRLLRADPTAARSTETPDARLEHLCTRWDETLKELAK